MLYAMVEPVRSSRKLKSLPVRAACGHLMKLYQYISDSVMICAPSLTYMFPYLQFVHTALMGPAVEAGTLSAIHNSQVNIVSQ
eukprot:6172345-Pleurochrysis_carterae.AAC.4